MTLRLTIGETLKRLSSLALSVLRQEVILVVTVSALRYRSHSGGDSVSVTVQESFWC